MTKAALKLTASDVRRIAISAQRLDGDRPKPTRAAILGLVHDIGYLQLDPTSVVARNPLQIVFTRLGPYETAHLEDLIARRKLFETPSLIVPTSDLHIHRATMRDYRRATEPDGRNERYRPGDNTGGGTWAPRVRRWLAQNPGLRREVLARLRREGPLPLSAFEDRAIVSWTSGGWNDERNLTMLLAILQRRGEVVVAGRRRGQKLYGLASGWYPKLRPLSGLALEEAATRRALRILGVATRKQLNWQYSFGRHITQRALDALERAGEVVRVEIADAPWKGQHYALADLRPPRDFEPRTALLSPFDNLIIDRDRTERLFGFHYRMEIYVPPHLRKRGYWAMPVLHGERIAGTIDPRMDRENKVLLVNKIVLEPSAPRGALPAMRRAVDELADWLGAERVRYA